MAYQSLARKYRPQTFADLAGQQVVSRVLTNAIQLGREPHAIIFSGIRGVGKTTTARLYAKALNCSTGPTATPCGSCEQCRAIEMGNHEDVLEIDGASHTSVDDVRALRETIHYVPQRSKFRIYIIDEVHMLSQSAFNALLKTLEEPPEHVVFVFATTELQKIPQTILSRCQTFTLQKFSLHDLVERINSILGQENLTFESEAVDWVAKQARGSMRDALTILDQIIALGDGSVTLAAAESVLGAVPSAAYLEFLSALIVKDKNRILSATESLSQAGASFVDFVEELASYCRHAFIVRSLGSKHQDLALLQLEPGILAQICDLSLQADPLAVHRMFRWLMQCRSEMDGSELDRFVFENYCFEWILDPGLPSIDEILASKVAGATAQTRARVEPAIPSQAPVAAAAPTERLERRPLNLRKNMLADVQERAQTPPSKVVDSLVTETTSNSATVIPNPAVKFPDSWRELVERWKQSKPLQARILEEVFLVSYSPKEIIVAVNSNSLAASKLLQTAVQVKVKEAFRELFAFSGDFKVQTKAEIPVANSENLTSDDRQGASLGEQESLLEVKAREKLHRNEQLIEEAKNHPITRNLVETFQAEIEDINIDS